MIEKKLKYFTLILLIFQFSNLLSQNFEVYFQTPFSSNINIQRIHQVNLVLQDIIDF